MSHLDSLVKLCFFFSVFPLFFLEKGVGTPPQAPGTQRAMNNEIGHSNAGFPLEGMGKCSPLFQSFSRSINLGKVDRRNVFKKKRI